MYLKERQKETEKERETGRARCVCADEDSRRFKSQLLAFTKDKKTRFRLQSGKVSFHLFAGGNFFPPLFRAIFI